MAWVLFKLPNFEHAVEYVSGMFVKSEIAVRISRAGVALLASCDRPTSHAAGLAGAPQGGPRAVPLRANGDAYASRSRTQHLVYLLPVLENRDEPKAPHLMVREAGAVFSITLGICWVTSRMIDGIPDFRDTTTDGEQKSVFDAYCTDSHRSDRRQFLSYEIERRIFLSHQR